ncbi:MAG: FKBP-type peptidyl-prolyl cis-trans isomerase [Dissulfurispiraceae bacterium]
MRVFVIAVLSVVLFAGQAVAEEKKQMSEKEKLSYSIGYTQGINLAGNLKAQSVDVDTNTIIEAFKTGLSGTAPVLTEQEMRQIISELQKSIAAKQSELMKEAAEKNKKAGESFLAENMKKIGVVTLPDGLQYKVMKEGTGEIPKATDKVKVNYRGTLIDGKEFDSSYKRGEPAVFPVKGGIIAGWTEALQLMRVGSKWELFIPSGLAYGTRAASPLVGPNSTLIFEIELLSIEK